MMLSQDRCIFQTTKTPFLSYTHIIKCLKLSLLYTISRLLLVQSQIFILHYE